MLARLLSVQDRYATGRGIGLLLLLMLPFGPAGAWRRRYLQQATGLNKPIFDSRFSYTRDEVVDSMTRMGPDGRRLYAITELTADIVFPLLYAPLVSLVLRWCARRFAPSSTLYPTLSLVPLGAIPFDYAENITLSIMLLRFPDAFGLSRLASTLTSAKCSMGVLSLGILLSMIAQAIISRFGRPTAR